MADALTHTTVNLIGARRADPVMKAGVLMGALLPDLISKPAQLFLNASYWTVAPTHSLFGILLTSFLISYLFTRKDRFFVFWGSLLWQGVHLMFDYTQKSYVPSYDLLHPFPVQVGQLNIIWGEQWIYASPVFVVVCLILYQKQILGYVLDR